MQTSTRNYTYHRPDRLEPTKSRRRLSPKLLIIIILLIASIFIIKKVFFNGGDSPYGSNATIGDTKQKEPPKKAVDTSGLHATLDQIIKKYPYDTGVSVIDLNSDTRIQSGDDYPYVAASTTKLLTALAYFHEVEAGQTSLDKVVGGKKASIQLQLMINKSDNDAWHSLNSSLGRDSLEAYAKEQGLTSYDATKNTVTSNDMAGLIAKLYKQQLINKSNTDLLLSWMQNTSEEQFIPPAVPDNVKMYHKAGYLTDRIHDVAIIDNGSAPFVLVIYSKSFTASYDFAVGEKMFKEITTSTMDTFNK